MCEHGYEYIDYYEDESFQVQNALLSAEGAIYYAKDKLSDAIHGSNIAVMGFGRIGKILAYLLRAQGAKVSVFARKDTDCTWGRLIGFETFRMEKMGIGAEIINSFDIIFNTIPYRIFDETIAMNINSNTIILDLASPPFCMDRALAEKYSLRYYREQGIPGRYAPKTAGAYLGNKIINILKGRN